MLRFKSTIRIICIVLGLVCNLKLSAQKPGDKVMKDFSPKSNAYSIYYPKSFLLQEDEEGIVTILDTLSHLNITISSYAVDEGMSEDRVIVTMSGFVKSYYKVELKKEDWNRYNTKFEIVVESKFEVEKTNWIWYGIVEKQRLIVVSLNKDLEFTQEEMRMIQFMITNMIVSG